MACTATPASLAEGPGSQDTRRQTNYNVSNMKLLPQHSLHCMRKKGDRPAGPLFLFFLLLLRWLSWEKASAAFCSRDTKISMSSSAQLRICWGTKILGFSRRKHSETIREIWAVERSPRPSQYAEPAFHATRLQFVQRLVSLHPNTETQRSWHQT